MTTIRLKNSKPWQVSLQSTKVNVFAVFATLICACALAITAPASRAQTEAPPAALNPQGESFAQWRSGFTTRAGERGHSASFVREVLAGVEPDLSIIELDRNQPEFVRPLWQYLDSAVSETRQTNGRARMGEEATLLAALEADTGVPAEIITAVWGLESAYGAFIGERDVVRSLATLSWDGRRRGLFERELLAVLDILASGAATREDLIGGWAGAMGQTQFMPSTYLAYAIDYDGDGRKDLWADRGDALGSAAAYLSGHGWRAGEPWAIEARAPANFNFALADGRRNTVSGWAQLGVTRADGQAWSSDQQDLRARVLAPAGASGPLFFTFANYDVIKRYNNSTSYAIAVGLLADALMERPGVRHPWPRDQRPLARTEVQELQTRLTQLGYDTEGVDGRVGPNTRKALRAWQADQGLAADAFPTGRVLEAVRLQSSAASR